MKHAALVAYFLASYSVGLVSLAVSLASFLRRRSAASRDFFLASLALSIVVACSMVLNIAGEAAPARLIEALELVNYACAVACVPLLPLMVHSAYRVQGSRAWNALFLALAAAAAGTGAVLSLLGAADLGGNVVLGAKNLAIVYAEARIIANRGRRRDGEIENVLHYIMIATLFAFPLIVASEHFPRSFRQLLPFEARGSVSLPLLYLAWGLAYLLSWLRGYIAPPAESDGAYREFSARKGLSPREVEVLRLLLRGQSYKEIMRSLSISMPTVKSHVGSIYRKAGCNNKMQLSLLFGSETGGSRRPGR